MRRLEKIVLEGIHYIVWDETQGTSPREKGAALLLSHKDGVGGDVLLVLPKERPLALRAYAKDGREVDADDAARRAALLALGRAIAAEADASGKTAGFVEIRLTDSFCARLFPAEQPSRIAG